MNANGIPETQIEAIRFFADEANCHKFMMKMRWSDGVPVCPHCASSEVGKLVASTREVAGRTLKSGKVIAPYTLTRRVWNCKACKKQFSVKVGTVFEDSSLGLEKWLPAVWMIVNAKNGISSCELARSLGITQKSAWHMGHRIRCALHDGSFEKMSGNVEADETFIGGRARSMNAKAKANRIKGTGSVGKTAVMGLLERTTRQSVSRVKLGILNGTKRADVQGPVREYVLKGSEVHTDALPSYTGLSSDYTHKVVDHSVCYVKDNVHTNGLENFWSLLKRTIKGTYVHVEPFHLFRYLDEQAYRFNERDGNDSDRFESVMNGLKGRLSYADLTGKNENV